MEAIQAEKKRQLVREHNETNQPLSSFILAPRPKALNKKSGKKFKK